MSKRLRSNKIDDHIRDEYSVDGKEAMVIKLVRNVDDIQSDECSFKPKYVHAMFSSDEKIFGYKGLKIMLYYSAASLITYFGIEYDEIVDESKFKPDDIVGSLRKVLLTPYISRLSEFKKIIAKEDNFIPHGKLLQKFNVTDTNGNNKELEIYFNESSNKDFVEYYKRAQIFVILYIETANYIDLDSKKWKVITIYEKYKDIKKSIKYSLVGYTTVYEFDMPQRNIRPRISQVLILPPYRRMGICAQMITAIYNYYVPNSKVVEISVESPCSDFQRIRDFIDCSNSLNFENFRPECLKKGLSENMINEVKTKLKLDRKQSIRVYEIIRLYYTNVEDTNEYRSYLASLKKIRSRCRKTQRLHRRRTNATTSTSSNAEVMDSKEQAMLELRYKHFLEEYQAVIKRIKKDKNDKKI